LSPVFKLHTICWKGNKGSERRREEGREGKREEKKEHIHVSTRHVPSRQGPYCGLGQAAAPPLLSAVAAVSTRACAAPSYCYCGSDTDVVAAAVDDAAAVLTTTALGVRAGTSWCLRLAARSDRPFERQGLGVVGAALQACRPSISCEARSQG